MTDAALSPFATAELLQQVEERCDLLREVVDGWCAWPLVRARAYLAIRGEEVVTEDARHRPHLRLLGPIFSDAARLLFLAQADVALLSHASARADHEGDRYRDIYYDDLIQLLERDGRVSGRHPRCAKIETADNPLFAERTRRALVPPRMGTTLGSSVAGALSRFGGRADADAAADRIAAALHDATGREILTAATIRRQFRKFHWGRRFYRSVLARIQPKSLVVVTSYGAFPIVAAARELGVRVIELQHGFLSSRHFGYSWTEYAAGYRDRMPIPDVIALYGESWANELRSGGFWGPEIAVVGSPQLDRYRDSRARHGVEDLSLTVTAQSVATERLLAYLKEFLSAAGNLPVRLYVKLHPAQRDASRFREVLGRDSRAVILAASDEPATFALLSRSCLHASIFSTCHYDALGLGVPTAILPFADYEMVAELLDTGAAFVCPEPADLLTLLQRSASIVVPPSIGERLYARGALEKLRRIVLDEEVPARGPSATEAHAALPAARFWLGAGGTADITPARPLPLAGFGSRQGPSTGVHDPLELNAIVLRAGDRAIGIVSADVLYGTDDLKRAMLADAGPAHMTAEQLMLAASHTHYAPSVDPSKPALGAYDPDYLTMVTVKGAGLLRGAATSPGEPWIASYGVAMAHHAINRRRTGWTRGGPLGVRRGMIMAPNPGGPVDERVHVMVFRSPEGTIRAILWSYACHPVSFPEPSQVSAAFPGIVRRALRAEFGAQLPIVFLQGFSGDIRPRAAGEPRTLAQRLRAVIDGTRFWPLTMAEHDAWAESLAAVVGTAARAARPLENPALDWQLERVPLDTFIEGDNGARTVTFHRLSIGSDLHVVGISAEVVTVFAAAVAANLPGTVIPVGCVDSVFGYLPTASMVAQGGYESGGFLPVFGLNGRFRAETEAAARAVVARVARGRQP